MARRVLITGGAGFIGSHVTDELLAAGYEVRIFDNGAAQVHGERNGPPPHLAREAEYIFGDVRNGRALERTLRNVDGVLHLAAVVGVGQSMYEVERYTAVNEQGSRDADAGAARTTRRARGRRLLDERLRRRPLSHQ